MYTPASGSDSACYARRDFFFFPFFIYLFVKKKQKMISGRIESRRLVVVHKSSRRRYPHALTTHYLGTYALRTMHVHMHLLEHGEDTLPGRSLPRYLYLI